MRKKMTLMVAVVALMVAMFTSAAFALDVDIDGDENNVDVTREGANVEFDATCQNLIGSIGDVEQSQYGNSDAVSGDADADADDESEATATSEATAEVDQSQWFTVVQANSCRNDF
jgi:hypothetical protein